MWNYQIPLTILIAIIISRINAIDFRYHRYDQMADFLYKFTSDHSNLASIYSIGDSVLGRKLLVVELTGANKSEIGIPNVKLIGNIHGNEAVGREVLLHFLQFMVENYESNKTIRWFMDNTRLHILPSLNPDGFERASMGLCDRGLGRENANGSDLNRSFPDFFQKNPQHPQPETIAVMEWMSRIPFVLSACLHGGALVANYPFENHYEDVWTLTFRWLNETLSKYDGISEKTNTINVENVEIGSPSIAPDDDVFQHLATVYANRHPTMHLGKPCPKSHKKFEGGITNGAAWYMITGGMQDYNYAFHGCMEVTLEISCCKYPFDSELPSLWEENKLALLDYIMEVHRGIKGVITDELTNKPIVNATLKILNRDINFHSSKNGEFWRLLRPGQYDLLISAQGYQPKTIKVTVTYPRAFVLPRLLQIQLMPTNVTFSGTTDVNNSSYSIYYNSFGNTIIKIDNNSVKNDLFVGETAEVKSNAPIFSFSVLLNCILVVFVVVLQA